MYMQTPITAHTVTSFDVHPVVSPFSPGPVGPAGGPAVGAGAGVGNGATTAGGGGATAGGGPQYILNTSGKVKIGTERGMNLMGFSSVFVLRQEMAGHAGGHAGGPPKVYVSSCSYRLVHRPEDATVIM